MKNWLKRHPKAFILVIVLVYLLAFVGTDIFFAVHSPADSSAETLDLAKISEKLEKQEVSIASVEDTQIQPVTLESIQSNHPETSVWNLLQDLPEQVDPKDWKLQIVNELFPLKEDITSPLYVGIDGQTYDERIKESVQAFMDASEKENYKLKIVSAYRNLATQTANYQSYKQVYLQQGLSSEEAEKKAREYVAPPKTSEHSLGLALDIVTQQWDQGGTGLVEDFAETPEAQWMKTHAKDYGFILRYLKGREKETGYQFEPWHFRYVGKEAADYIDRHGLTLEEYVVLVYAKNGIELTYKVDEDLKVE